MRFRYPGIDLAPPVVIDQEPAFYKMRGAKALAPSAMSDDGMATTISWPADTPIPAVYAVDANGQETIVNGAMREGAFVVDAIAPRFVFRSGKLKATATRKVAKVKP